MFGFDCEASVGTRPLPISLTPPHVRGQMEDFMMMGDVYGGLG